MQDTLDDPDLAWLLCAEASAGMFPMATPLS